MILVDTSALVDFARQWNPNRLLTFLDFLRQGTTPEPVWDILAITTAAGGPQPPYRHHSGVKNLTIHRITISFLRYLRDSGILILNLSCDIAASG